MIEVKAPLVECDGDPFAVSQQSIIPSVHLNVQFDTIRHHCVQVHFIICEVAPIYPR